VNSDRDFQAVSDRRRKQLATFRAPNLDGPARPALLDIDAELESHELRELKRPLGHREFPHAKVTLRTLRAQERKTILLQRPDSVLEAPINLHSQPTQPALRPDCADR
jgi:hypothetical protein